MNGRGLRILTKKEMKKKNQRDLNNIKWNASDVDGRTCNLDSFPLSWLHKYGGDDMMPDSSVWAKKKKNWRVRGKTEPKAGWGWASAGRSPKLEKGREGWSVDLFRVNESNFKDFWESKWLDLSPLSRSYLVFSILADLNSISSEIHFSMVAHKDKTPPPR